MKTVFLLTVCRTVRLVVNESVVACIANCGCRWSLYLLNRVVFDVTNYIFLCLLNSIFKRSNLAGMH